jgi:uncharacterized protein (DUF58 family)
MSASHSLAPAPMEARLQKFGKLGFGFGPRFLVMMLLGVLWVVPVWWSSRMIVAVIVWDLVVVAAFFMDYLRLPSPGDIRVSREFEHAPAIATASRVILHVANPGRAAIRCGVVDETPVSFRNSPPLLEVVIAARATETSPYAILPSERGDVHMGRVFVRYQSRLGFAERWGVAEISQTVRVLPDLSQAQKHALYLIRSRQVEMEKRRRRQKGQGREFQSLRDYQQGDDLRDICWTATARRHGLTTRVFEIERSQTVWIVLDAGRLLRARVRDEDSGLRLSKLDYAVNAALSVAQVATQSGDKVGLLAYGRAVQQNIPVGRGAAHLRTLVNSLAQVRGEAGEADHSGAARTLLRGQHRRSLVVWITDFAETPTLPEVIEYATQLTRRHLVVFAAVSQPDLAALAQAVPQTTTDMFRHAAALEITHRRDLLLLGLRERGIFAFELAPGLLASTMVNQYLDIKERNLL